MNYLSSLIIFMTSGIFNPRENIKTYPVHSIKEEITITGKGDHVLWNNAYELSDFSYPWENGTPSRTVFKALHSEEWFYGLFYVEDNNLNIYIDTNEKMEIILSDRAEIFFKKDDQMNPYYCLELDPLGRVFDCKGESPRKIDAQWSWPTDHLRVKAHKNNEGYTIEVAISKRSLKDLGMLNSNILRVGLYRADCISLNGKKADFRWISWITPRSETPDFHIPSSFGILELMD